MANEIRDGFKFRGGSLPLDFAATLAGRFRSAPREQLREPEDLARWLVAAGLAPRKPSVTAEELQQARKLREALYRLALARVESRPYADSDRSLLNRWATLPTPAPRLEREGMSWTREGPSGLLALLARSAVELLGSDSVRIMQCAGESCALLFLDNSRSGHRKWCSMAGCGNKAKVASFRERSRE